MVDRRDMKRYEDGLGGHIEILEEGSEIAPVRFRMVMPPGFGPPAPESHPHQTEDFLVVRGTLDLGIIDGQHVRLEAGDRYHLPAGIYHLPRNAGQGELEFEATLTPGKTTAEMFAQLYTETRESKGLGQFLRQALVFSGHANSITFRRPVLWMLRTAAVIARILGIRLRGTERQASGKAERTI